MVPEDLLFWIAPMAGTPHDDQRVLCRRHADAMSVPRGWTLDDRREEFPRLFRPRPVDRPEASTSQPRPPRPARHREAVEQLVIDGTGEIGRPIVPDEVIDAAVAGGEMAEGPLDDGPVDEAAPWSPDFDHESNLGGLLDVQSPLLARAFRGTDRRRS